MNLPFESTPEILDRHVCGFRAYRKRFPNRQRIRDRGQGDFPFGEFTAPTAVFDELRKQIARKGRFIVAIYFRQAVRRILQTIRIRHHVIGFA